MWVGAALYEKTVICPASCLVPVKKVPGFRSPPPQVIIYVQNRTDVFCGTLMKA